MRRGQDKFIDKLVAGKQGWKITAEGVAAFWEERRRGREEAREQDEKKVPKKRVSLNPRHDS